MVNNDPLGPLPVTAYDAAPVVALDADFNVRWAAWIARGRVHEQMVRRKLVVGAGSLAAGTAIVYAFMRS